MRGRQTVKLKTTLPPNRQQQLWDAHPSFTETHIAGKLDLCVGLPVMIRNNEATELCITKGQEGRVAGWTEATGNQGQRILDTLFVELIDPPENYPSPRSARKHSSYNEDIKKSLVYVARRHVVANNKRTSIGAA
jgi:hypothetical protein